MDLPVEVETVLAWSYEAQLLEFHPRRFVDGLYNVFYENVFEALNQMQSYLCQELAPLEKDVVSSETIKLRTDSMFQKLREKLDKSIDRFEAYLCTNLVHISENVVLPEDKIHTTYSCTEDDVLKIDQEIEELKEQIMKEKVRKSLWAQKAAEQKLVKKELSCMLEKLQDISQILRKNSPEVLNQTANKCADLCKIINTYMEIKGQV